MAENNSEVLFSVKRRKEYNKFKKEINFSVEELGRHNKEYLVEIETWSKASGLPVPPSCKMPKLYLPNSLPLSLKLEKYFVDQSMYYRDATKIHGFKVNLPPVEMPEFIGESFSIGKICSWALRENVDLKQTDFFILSRAFRDIAAAATIGRHSYWEYGVLCYKGKIFIEGTIPESERYWKRGLKKEPRNFIDGNLFFVEKENGEIKIESINPTSDYKRREKLMTMAPKLIELYKESKINSELGKYGCKFEDILRSGGPGDPLYNGKNTEFQMAKCNKLISICGHKIMTATRISGQEPCGPIESPENHVEMKTMFRLSKEKFASIKSQSLWIHCALVGVDAVYCGFRCMDGTLTEIKKYTMDELVDIGKDYWNPNEILTFLDTFLSWLKEKLNKNAVRSRRHKSWLKDELSCEEGSTFTLSYSGDGYISLEKGDHPELKKVISERYDHNQSVCDSREKINVPKSSEGIPSGIPDNWDDSD